MNTSTTELPSRPTHEFTLGNGLKIIVREDHRTPEVFSNLCHKVGSSYESTGEQGLSLILGKLSFQGETELLTNIGAVFNGFLREDVTSSSLLLHPDHLHVAFEIHATGMTNLNLSEEELRQCIETNKELYYAPTFSSDVHISDPFNAIIFPESGYGAPSFSAIEGLEQITVEQVTRWHQNWYAPNNSTLVVVGDVEPNEVVVLAQRLLGGIARREIPPARSARELSEPGERQITLHLNTKRPRLQMAFNTPSMATASDPGEMRALQVIDSLLTEGPEAWIPKRLIERENVLQHASSRTDQYCRGDDIFFISVTTSEQNQKSLDEVQSSLWQLLDELKIAPISDEDLALAKTRLISRLEAPDDISAQGDVIGMLEGTGQSWTLIDRVVQELQSVTAVDIQNAAKTYFTRERLSVAYVLPREYSPE